MKKFVSLLLIAFMIATFAACSNNTNNNVQNSQTNQLDKEGVMPYNLTESDKHLLNAFGMRDSSQIISFKAPKEALTIQTNVYRLSGDNTWEQIDGSGTALMRENENDTPFEGVFTMILKDNYSVELRITTDSGTQVSSITDELTLEDSATASLKGFLTQSQKIELNREIPVAIMVYDSSTAMRSCTLSDYFDPSKLSGMDLVQAVTLTFGNGDI